MTRRCRGQRRRDGTSRRRGGDWWLSPIARKAPLANPQGRMCSARSRRILQPGRGGPTAFDEWHGASASPPSSRPLGRTCGGTPCCHPGVRAGGYRVGARGHPRLVRLGGRRGRCTGGVRRRRGLRSGREHGPAWGAAGQHAAAMARGSSSVRGGEVPFNRCRWHRCRDCRSALPRRAVGVPAPLQSCLLGELSLCGWHRKPLRDVLG